jgi:hypothetical protein
LFANVKDHCTVQESSSKAKKLVTLLLHTVILNAQIVANVNQLTVALKGKRRPKIDPPIKLNVSQCDMV